MSEVPEEEELRNESEKEECEKKGKENLETTDKGQEEEALEGPRLEWLLQQVQRREDELLKRHSGEQLQEFLSLISREADHGLESHAGCVLQRHPVFRSVMVRRWQDYEAEQREALNSDDTKVDVMSLKGRRYDDEEMERKIFEEMERLVSEDTEEVEEEMEICVEDAMVEGPRLEWLLQQVKERADELVQRHSPNQLQEFLELVCWEAQHGHGTNAGSDLQRHPVCRSIVSQAWKGTTDTKGLRVVIEGTAAEMKKGTCLEGDGVKDEEKAGVLLQPLEKAANGPLCKEQTIDMNEVVRVGESVKMVKAGNEEEKLDEGNDESVRDHGDFEEGVEGDGNVREDESDSEEEEKEKDEDQVETEKE